MLHKYEEKVYAGLLGKVIGVYLGRPIEGWDYEAVRDTVGRVEYYLNDKLHVPLVVTDDDISGTLTFLRAIADNGYPKLVTPEMVGETWLNYLVEGRSTICWAGIGSLPAATGYYRMKEGIPPPLSGSAQLNTKQLSEQDGSQIFVDGWAMVCPDDPEKAAELAKIASCVAFDGEAIYGAQCWAAMEAKAFSCVSVDELLDTGLSVIPEQCVIARMIRELRAFHAQNNNWEAGWHWLRANYGYDKYPGSCPIVPNHGVMILGLLYCEGSFQKAMMISNSVGWDTDCNAANLGCLIGIMLGLEGLEAGPDWRGPVADRLYNAVADGGQAVSDVATEAMKIINSYRLTNDLEALEPKQGMRYHFEFPGSVQGWRRQSGLLENVLRLQNVGGHSRLGKRALALRYYKLSPGVSARAFTDTFVPQEDKDWILSAHYPLDCSPSLYRGQTIHAGLSADADNTLPITCRLFIGQYGDYDNTEIIYDTAFTLAPGEEASLDWTLSGIPSRPIHQVGIELYELAYNQSNSGSVYLDCLGWSGEPNLVLKQPDFGVFRRGSPYTAGKMWKASWVDTCNVHLSQPSDASFSLIHNGGTGHLITGANSWKDYRVEADITIHMAESGGIAARVQGLRRYYALIIDSRGFATLFKQLNGKCILAITPFTFENYKTYRLALKVCGNEISGKLDGERLFTCVDDDPLRLAFGGIALLCENGKITSDQVTVSLL